MKTIWKFPLEIIDEKILVMPVGAQILCVQEQHDEIKLWALCDRLETDLELRKFRIFGTDHEVSPQLDLEDYIGTVQIHSGALVFHVFETTGVVS